KIAPRFTTPVGNSDGWRVVDAAAAYGCRGLGSQDLPGGIGGVVGVVVAGVGRVVVARHVQQLGDVAVVSLGDVRAAHLVGRPGHCTCAVHRQNPSLEVLGGRRRRAADLVANAPENDAGMVAVAFDHVLDVSLRPGSEVEAVVVGGLV